MRHSIFRLRSLFSTFLILFIKINVSKFKSNFLWFKSMEIEHFRNSESIRWVGEFSITVGINIFCPKNNRIVLYIFIYLLNRNIKNDNYCIRLAGSMLWIFVLYSNIFVGYHTMLAFICTIHMDGLYLPITSPAVRAQAPNIFFRFSISINPKMNTSNRVHKLFSSRSLST